MGVKRNIQVKQIMRSKLAQGGLANTGRFAKRYGDATNENPRLPISESSITTQSSFNSTTRRLPPIYFESQTVDMFGRTQGTRKDLLRVGKGALSFGYTPARTGIVSIDIILQGVIVGGIEGNIGEAFMHDYKTLFRFTESSTTQIGTAGGKKTQIFQDSNVGSPALYISYDTSQQDGESLNTFGRFIFMISNTGNRITEWTAQATFRLGEHKLYQPGDSGGAIWQNKIPLLFENNDQLLWN
jgi:hypothetical protein